MVILGAVRSDLIIFSPSLVYQYVCLYQISKYLPAQQFISHLPVKRFDIPVLPRTPRFDKQRLHLQPVQPLPHSFSCELGSIIRADVFRYAAEYKQVKQFVDNIIRFNLSFDQCSQTLLGVFVNDIQFLKSFAIGREVYHEIPISKKIKPTFGMNPIIAKTTELNAEFAYTIAKQLKYILTMNSHRYPLR